MQQVLPGAFTLAPLPSLLTLPISPICWLKGSMFKGGPQSQTQEIILNWSEPTMITLLPFDADWFRGCCKEKYAVWLLGGGESSMMKREIEGEAHFTFLPAFG